MQHLLLAVISLVAGIVLAVEFSATGVTRLAIAMMIAFFASSVYQVFYAHAHHVHKHVI